MPSVGTEAALRIAARDALRLLRERHTDARGVWHDEWAKLVGQSLQTALGFCDECGQCGNEWRGQPDTGHECSKCGSPGA